ncbi:MAG: DUF4442 domain-containing protein [Bdellovibrionales bacterium]|nr:DUF4442 domain-containing protein [Bdellovibrionales bacterium]
MNLENLKLTALINAYSALQIPLLAFVTPKVVELTDERSEVRVRLDRRSRNHLKVMYFGALAMGAELSIALKAIQAISHSGKRIDFIFKDFKAEFLKRADGHVHFVCLEAAEVQNLIENVAQSDERMEATFNGFAYVPGKSTEPVMKYTLTLSVRKRAG